MRRLLSYLIKNYAFVLFLLLEGIALTLVFSHNSYQKAKYLNSANWVSGKIYQTFNSVVEYFQLAHINKELSEENARLRTLVENIQGVSVERDSVPGISDEKDLEFQFISARIINNSVNRPYNYFTLNKGRRHGIKPDQGVISGKGIVGVVASVSESYAVGLSLLNQRWSVSAMLKKSGNFGSLVWRGTNYQMANLAEIPLHVDVFPGDTVITSGYSSIFPKGIMVGTIHNVTRPEGENYYEIKVKLSADFKSLSYVEVIENSNKFEIDELEKIIRDDSGAN
jgi:rod shape-determining protein MreC